VQVLLRLAFNAPPHRVLENLSAARRQSCKITFRRELCTCSPPLYSINPNRRNLFMKKLTRDRVVPIISASVSWLTLAMTGSGFPSLPKSAIGKVAPTVRFGAQSPVSAEASVAPELFDLRRGQAGDVLSRKVFNADFGRLRLGVLELRLRDPLNRWGVGLALYRGPAW
jgi:hypothetical protein